MENNSDSYYKILEVEPTATTEEIARSYRKLALKYHPDRNPNNPEAEAKFKLINEANEVLTDPQRRRIYDQFGKEGLQNGPNPFQSGNPMDIFSQMFGGMNPFGRQPQRKYEKVIQIPMEISIYDIYNGTTLQKTIDTETVCRICESQKRMCSQCHGRGVNIMSRQMGPIQIQQQVPCALCHGEKWIINANPNCNLCNGKGKMTSPKTLNVNVPKGQEYGRPIEMPEGDVMYVVVPVPDKADIYKRHGRDVVYEKTLSLIEALVGVDIPLKVPSGDTHIFRCQGIIQPETYRRIRGYGLPSEEGKGDLIIEFKIDLTVSANELELIRNVFSTYQLSDTVHDKIIVTDEN